MKFFIVKIILITIFFTSFANAQEFDKEDEVKNNSAQQTLLGKNKSHIGWYFAPLVQGSFFDDKISIVSGGEVGLVLNHSIMIGVSGKGICTRKKFPERYNGNTVYLRSGWGGLSIGYIFKPASVVHFYVLTNIGGGGISNENGENLKSFFAGEIQGCLEINVVNFLHIVPYIGYHIFYNDFSYLGITADKLSGFDFGLKIVFGTF